MRIYTVDVPSSYQPDKQNLVSPPHNTQWGVEQDFYKWVQENLKWCRVYDADWMYVPIFWNRYYVNCWGECGVEELQAYLDWLAGFPEWQMNVFTICEYDLEAYNQYNLHGMRVLTGSRIGEQGIDIPLLCAPHVEPAVLPKKEHLASFVGNCTFGVRQEMKEAIEGRPDCVVRHAQEGTDYFVDLMLKSYLALCPRGYGGQTMRMYEAMNLGVAPLLIGDYDTRPFKQWIDWDEFSFYMPNSKGLDRFLDTLDPSQLLAMGKKAKEVWAEEIQYGKWGKYVLEELQTL